MTNSPQAGDVVFCLQGNAIGQRCVIDGQIGRPFEAGETVKATANARAYNHGFNISCSGGPGYQIPVADLVPTGRIIDREFIPVVNGQFEEPITNKVAVWTWKDSTNAFGLYPEQTVDEILDRKAAFARKAAAIEAQIAELGRPTGDGVHVLMRGQHRSHIKFDTAITTYTQVVEDYYGDHLLATAQGFGHISYRDLGGDLAIGAALHLLALSCNGESVNIKFHSLDALTAFLRAYGLEDAFANAKQFDNFKLFAPNADPATWQRLHWQRA